MSRAGLRLAVACGLLAACAGQGPFGRLSPEERGEKLARDGVALQRIVSGLEDLMARARAKGLLDLPDDASTSVEQRGRFRLFFAAFLDHAVALDALRGYYDGRAELGAAKEAEAFLLAYTADLALYVNTGELLRKTVGRRTYEVLLDEPGPEYPDGAWERLKAAYNRQPWQRPLVLAHLRHEALSETYGRAGVRARQAWLADYADRRWRTMVELGAQEAPDIAVRGWRDLIGEGFARVWFPAQAHVAEWMGDTRVRRGHDSLVGPEQIDALRARLRTGDLLVERRNWYLSNIGLPGFWPHAAIYLGTPEEARAALGAEGVARLFASHPGAAAAWAGDDGGGHPNRVIEAVSEGVVFTTLEHSAGADYVAALRPRLAPADVARAVGRAFAYHGRPYDFDFDFLTDAALVCTELAYKAYEPAPGEPGLHLTLVEVLGRPTLPANELVRQWAEGPSQQLDFIAFLDGREGKGRAVEADEEALRASWRRPKWDLAQP